MLSLPQMLHKCRDQPFRLDHVSISRRYFTCCAVILYKFKAHLASLLLLMRSRAMKVPTTATTNTALSTVDGDRDILLLQLCRTPKPSLAIFSIRLFLSLE